MCMTLFCLIMVWHGFLSCRKKIFTEASATFQDAISKEINTRLGSIPIKTNRGTLLLSDSISYEEKERWCDQDYLSLNDPNRIFLDSLFRARLADLGMETQTAVRCKRKEKTTISYTDSLFMKKATALKPVINALKKEKIGKAERDAVSAAIVRLRESLAPMPFIQIKSCRGTGYQLIISNPEEI